MKVTTDARVILMQGSPARVLKGEKGDPGPMGPQGPQGEKGEPGPMGPQGEKGDIGPQGEKGEKGDTGPQGERGEIGPQGPQGELGPQGERGPQGEQGEKGEPGEAGPQGPAGADAVVDATLTQSGQAAEAKATGEAIGRLKGDNATLTNTTTTPVAAGMVWTSTANGAGWEEPKGSDGSEADEWVIIAGTSGHPEPDWVLSEDANTIIFDKDVNGNDYEIDELVVIGFTAKGTVDSRLSITAYALRYKDQTKIINGISSVYGQKAIATTGNKVIQLYSKLFKNAGFMSISGNPAIASWSSFASPQEYRVAANSQAGWADAWRRIVIRAVTTSAVIPAGTRFYIAGHKAKGGN